MNAEEFEIYAKKRVMKIVLRQKINGLDVLVADGFTNTPPKQSGFPAAYVTHAAWGHSGKYIRSYREFFEWNKPGGRFEDQKKRIDSVMQIINKTSENKHLVTKSG